MKKTTSNLNSIWTLYAASGVCAVMAAYLQAGPIYALGWMSGFLLVASIAATIP